MSCANTSLPRFIDAPTKLRFAGCQNRHSQFKSRPKEFAADAFLINNLRKARGKTLGHYCLGLTVNKLALELHVPATRIGEIVHERRRITAETALRLARYFNTNAEFWLNLQNFYDLEVSRRSGKVSEIERQVHPVLAP